MKIITLLILSLLSTTLFADQIYIIGSSSHIQYRYDPKVTDKTGGLGYESGNYGAAIYSNSINKITTVVYFKHKYTANLSQSIGLATGYNDTVAPLPLTAYRFGNFRIATTFPFGKLAGAATDATNFQYVYDF